IERDLSINRNRFYDTEDLSVLAANALGIVNGKTADTFSPEQSITRQEAAVMLARAAEVLAFKKGSTAISYSDSKKIASWAAESVKFVSTTKDKSNNAAVMGGTGNNQFSPLGTLTKQQAIIAVKRLFNAK